MIPDGLPNQFLNWRTVNGRKIPCAPNGDPVNAHDPQVWLSYDQAKSAPYGVAFALTADDPWFFLDMDKCATDGQWTPQATAIFNSFTGAWGEISQSGKGLHILGKCDKSQLTDRRNKWEGWLEFYTQERFIAFGDTGWSRIGGVDIDKDFTQQLLNFVPQREFLGELPDGIDPTYTGPDDDDKLIKMMLDSSSTANAFGEGVTAADLWNADRTVLCKKFPDYDGDPNDFDHSSADMAMMCHLAFWTGKDMPRMDRLFRRSGLMRDKYDVRDDYRNDTVQKAARITKRVYDWKKPEPITDMATDPRMKEQYLNIQEMQKHFAGCVYIRDAHRVLIPDGSLLKSEQFNATYGGYYFQMMPDGTKSTRKAWEAFTENPMYHFPKGIREVFRPDLPPGLILNDGGVNIYVDPQVKLTTGDPSPVINHINKLLPNDIDRKILINYMAAVVQHPGVKFQWCPVIQGVEGNGKTLLATCVAEAVGLQYVHSPIAENLGEKYNDYVEGRIFIIVEEIWMKGRLEMLNVLKPLITNQRIEVRSMGRDKRMIDNVTNWFMCTNHRDAIIKSRSDRRYAIMYTAQQEFDDIARDGMDGEYFPDLYHWLRNGGYAVVSHWLKTYPIDPEFNPADKCHRAPITSSTNDAIEISEGPIEKEIKEAIALGMPGFNGGWIDSLSLTNLIADKRIRAQHTTIVECVKQMGYTEFQRADRPIMYLEGLQPMLYCNNSVSDRSTDGYIKAQGWR